MCLIMETVEVDIFTFDFMVVCHGAPGEFHLSPVFKYIHLKQYKFTVMCTFTYR